MSRISICKAKIPAILRWVFQAVTLGPRTSLLLNTAIVPGLDGLAGSITVSHDGGYGVLAGKAVSLEPATGYSFDSPLVSRPR